MLSKNDAKYIQSLQYKKSRNEEGVFIAEGVKLVNEIIQSGWGVKKIFATHEWIAENKAGNVQVAEVSEQELKKISLLQTPNQVLALVEQKKQTGHIHLKNRFTLVLDGIQDPGNLGTIIRIADWFGIEAIVCSNDTAELYNPKVIQSTMGSFLRVDIVYEDLLPLFKNLTVPVFGAVLNGKNINETASVKEGVLMIGNEGNGIKKELLPFIQQPVTIPKLGGAESLNAAVATGIIVSHLLKQ
jgi:rRNA methylases